MNEDKLEQGEVHIINGKSVQVYPSKNNNKDNYIHDFKNSKRNVIIKFCNFLGRGKGEDKKCSFCKGGKGSKDKYIKCKNQSKTKREGMFPVQLDDEGKQSKRRNCKNKRNDLVVSPVALAMPFVPCVSLNTHLEHMYHPDQVASAPTKQNIS